MRSLHPVFAVPAIAVIDAGVVAAFAAIDAAGSPDRVYSVAGAAYLHFVYAGLLALAVGSVLAAPFWYLGRHVPRPRSIWLTGIGGIAGLLIALGFGGREGAELAIVLTMIGALSGLLWWGLVDRGRTDLWPDRG